MIMYVRFLALVLVVIALALISACSYKMSGSDVIYESYNCEDGIVSDEFAYRRPAPGESGPSLRGAHIVYPSIYFQGELYFWQRMFLQDILPDTYVLVGEIYHVGERKPSENFQFTALFEASGEIFYNKDEPDILVVKISTDWISYQYVIFNRLLRLAHR